MTEHTPGPWEARRAEARDLGPWEDYTAITLPGFGGLTPIALVPTHARAHTAQERDANARLIAAAPDLLLACQNMLRDLREQRDTKLCSRSRDQQIAELRTAILKATGGQS